MKLNDTITIYTRVSASDGAGGRTPGVLTENYNTFANVKPLSGGLSMQFQQLHGTQGFDVWIRSDFDRTPSRKWIIEYNGIYGDITLTIESIEIGRNYTKLICKNRTGETDEDAS